MRKLVLTTDDDVIRKARWLAKKRHTSVSKLISGVVRNMAADESSPEDLPPVLRELSGIVKLPKGKSVDDLLKEAIFEKHGFGG